MRVKVLTGARVAIARKKESQNDSNSHLDSKTLDQKKLKSYGDSQSLSKYICEYQHHLTRNTRIEAPFARFPALSFWTSYFELLSWKVFGIPWWRASGQNLMFHFPLYLPPVLDDESLMTHLKLWLAPPIEPESGSDSDPMEQLKTAELAWNVEVKENEAESEQPLRRIKQLNCHSSSEYRQRPTANEGLDSKTKMTANSWDDIGCKYPSSERL